LMIDAPLNKNYVFDAKTVKDLKQKFFKNTIAPEELLKELYENNDYEGLYHVCDTCLINLKIQKIKNHTKHQVIVYFSQLSFPLFSFLKFNKPNFFG